jgi:hypothetical protein
MKHAERKKIKHGFCWFNGSCSQESTAKLSKFCLTCPHFESTGPTINVSRENAIIAAADGMPTELAVKGIELLSLMLEKDINISNLEAVRYIKHGPEMKQALKSLCAMCKETNKLPCDKSCITQDLLTKLDKEG